EAYYAAKNVFLLEGGNQLQSGEVVLSRGICPDSIFYRSEFYHDWVRPQGLGAAGIVATVLRGESTVGLFGFLKAADAPDPSEAELKLARALVPHLQRAVQFHHRLSELEVAQRMAVGALDQWSTAAIVTDRDGTALLTNAAADALLRAGDGLCVRKGRIDASH